MDRLANLDPVLGTPERTAALAILANVRLVELSFIADHLAIPSAEATQHMDALIDAGYVRMRRGTIGIGGRRWYRMRSRGEAALKAHLKTLQQMRAATA